MGERIRAEDGVGRACTLILGHLAKAGALAI